jgi:hypothetical protein
MNSTYFAQLPRFDAPDFNVTETVADSVQDPPAVRDAPAPAPLSEPEPADLGALLADIVRAADARGAAIRNLAADMTERLARVLFPRLAEDFLAREIALCIPALLPDPPLVLTVRAPSRAAASLGALVAGAGRAAAPSLSTPNPATPTSRSTGPSAVSILILMPRWTPVSPTSRRNFHTQRPSHEQA